MSEDKQEPTYLCPLDILPKDTAIDAIKRPLRLIESGMVVNGKSYAILRDREYGDLIFSYNGRLVILQMINFKLCAKTMIEETIEEEKHETEQKTGPGKI